MAHLGTAVVASPLELTWPSSDMAHGATCQKTISVKILGGYCELSTVRHIQGPPSGAVVAQQPSLALRSQHSAQGWDPRCGRAEAAISRHSRELPSAQQALAPKKQHCEAVMTLSRTQHPGKWGAFLGCLTLLSPQLITWAEATIRQEAPALIQAVVPRHIC